MLLATIAATADNKLSHFAVRLALSGHVDIPREDEPDILGEADAVFTPMQPRTKAPKTGKPPVGMSKPKPQTKKPKTAKKQIAA